MASESPFRRSPTRFFLVVFALSVPFWLLGAVAERWAEVVPIPLPASALIAICPLLAALLLLRREGGGEAVRRWLVGMGRGARGGLLWLLPAALLTPTLVVLAYAATRSARSPSASPPSLTLAALLVALFVAAAFTEEAGWMGYAFPSLLERWGALGAALVLGAVWALWHLIPWYQTRPSANWIAWQAVVIVALRILIVWLYLNAGRRLAAAVLAHASYNAAIYLLPGRGADYDPLATAIPALLAAAAVVLLWGPATLTRWRWRRSAR